MVYIYQPSIRLPDTYDSDAFKIDSDNNINRITNIPNIKRPYVSK